MGWKILVNVLLNLGIFTLGLCVYWGVNHQHWGIVAGAAFAFSLLIYFKIRLVKSVREMQKK
jgi:hypothetical protein